MSALTGTRVAIIGGTSGIGLAVAHEALRRGAGVTVASRRRSSVDAAVAELGGAEGRILDVTDPASVASFVASVDDLDHLVFTAGDALARGPLADYTVERARAFFETRLFHMLATVQAAVPHLRTGGSITLTSSASAYRGGPGRLLAAALSGAIISATRSLAAELAPTRVNAVAPGVVDTPLWSDLGDEGRSALLAAAGEQTLVHRSAEPADLVPAYLYFMEADYVTGDIAVVDGGAALV